MLLDKDELEQKDLLEESTISKLNTLTILWIIAGSLGVMIGLSFLYLDISNPISYNDEKRFFFRVIFIFSTFIFGALAINGIRYRIALNNSMEKESIIRIPNFAIYFWIMISMLCCIFWYMVENNFI